MSTKNAPKFKFEIENYVATSNATARLYKVRPASPAGKWYSPDTHSFYLEIARLSDGKKQYSWKSKGWSDTDSWAHPRFMFWEREEAFWRSEQELRRIPGVKFDEYGFVVRSLLPTQPEGGR